MDRSDTDSLAPYSSKGQFQDQDFNSMAESTEERTTLLGQPIPQGKDRLHDHHTNMMMADGGGYGMPGAGANLLPPGYTDSSIIRAPIRLSDLGLEPEPAAETVENSDNYSPEIQVAKKGVFGGMFKGKKSKSTPSRQKQREADFRLVMMSRGDYLKYWVKDEKGNFLPSVQDPPEGRREWLKKQLVLNEEWLKKDPTLAGAKPQGRQKITFQSLMTNVGNSTEWSLY